MLYNTAKSAGTYSIYASGNSSEYLITPKFAAGKITWKQMRRGSNSKNAQIKVYKATKGDDDKYTIGTTELATLTGKQQDSSFSDGSIDLDEDSQLAFLLSYGCIDAFTAEEGLYVEGAIAKPKALTVTDLTDESAVLGWTSDATSFNIQYKAADDADYTLIENVTDNPYTLTGLDAGTTYTFQVQAIVGGETSGWSSAASFTTPFCASSAQKDITITMWDTYGDGWNGASIVIEDDATKTEISRFTLTSSDGKNNVVNTASLCPGRNYNINWVSGSFNSECRFTVKDVNNETLLDYSSTYPSSSSTLTTYMWEEEAPVDGAKFKINTDGTTQDFGFAAANEVAEKTYTITNNGNANLTVSFTTPEGFNISGYDGSDWIVEAGASRDFTVVMNTTVAGVKIGNIELSFNAVNATSFTIPVTGRVADLDKYFVNFNNNTLPDLWTNGSNSGASWTFADGVAYGQYASYKNAKMMSPLLTVAEGESLIFQTKGNSNYSDMKVNVYQRDGSTKVTTVDFSTEARAAYAAGEYTMVTLSGLEAGDYKLEFEAYNTYIDNINGFTLNLNDPKMGVYTDEECTQANKVAATSVTAEFGFVTADPTPAIYYIKNDGTGTMTLVKGADPAGLTVTLDKTSVAAGEHATLTIAMPVANNSGYHGGDVVVTATDLGDFTVKAQGVVVEEGKLNLDFSTDDIPATWTANSWSKKAGGYIEVGYSSSTMQTSNLVAAAGEKLVVLAKQSYTSSSYTFGVKYKNMDDAEADWEDLIPAANIGTNYVMLYGAIATAGTYQLQFTGNYTQIQRIYGLSKPDAPEMVVYDGENVASASYSFGKVTDEADATWTLTVKNEGKAALTGLAVALTGDNADHYTAVIEDNKTELAKNETAIITVTQLKDNLGSHSATLTISATDVDSKEIALSGNTIDHTVLDVDFADGQWPAGWQHGSNWSIWSGSAQQSSSSIASSVITAPLTIANDTDKLKFQLARYNSNYFDLTVRYTTDGGITWQDYDWSNYAGTWNDGESLRDQITSTFKEFEITGIPAGTVAFDFYGKYIKLDNFTGDYKNATAPLMALTTVEDNITGANLKADATATYTLANNGNADYVGTVATTNVTAEATGDGVTFESNTLTIPAGKTATITVTMAFAAPYGEKTADLSITSESWVGDITANYTANLVEPTDFVEDFAAGKPAGWYNGGWTISGGDAYVYTGTNKELITEKLGVDSDKNVLSFDAKVYSGSDEQTLNVYTSADRRNWSEPQSFTLTSDAQNFSLKTLTEDCYVKFEAANASIDNLTGVKKRELPDHDLMFVSVSDLKTNYTPGETASATLQIANLLATAEENVHVWAYYRKNGELTASSWVTSGPNSIGAGATTGISLSDYAPAEEATYDVMIVVSPNDDENDAAAIQMIRDEAFTVAHVTSLTINNFEVAKSPVQADADNEFAATFNVKVTNTGSTTLAAEDVSVTLTDTSDSEKTFTVTLSDVTAEVSVLEPSETFTLPVTVSGAAGTGGSFSYKATENVSNTTYSLNCTVSVTPTTVDIAISEYGYATFADEHALDLGNLPAGLKVFYVTADNIHTNSVGLTEASGKVKEGTGLLVKGAEGNYKVYATKKSEATGIDGNLLVGCLGETNLDANASLYVLSVGKGDRAEFQSLSQKGATIPAGKAYLDATSVSGAGARLVINFDSETTGVVSMDNGKWTMDNEAGAWYDLQGRPVERSMFNVQRSMLKKGVYIRNGRKVVIK